MSCRLRKILQRIDLEKATIEEIEELFSKNILGHNRPSINISPEGLFRARIVTGKDMKDLATTKSIWYPDFSEIDEQHHRFGRCSTKGQNFFYASNYLGTTIYELNPMDSDLVLVGIFHKQNPQTKIRSQFAGIEALRHSPEHNSMLADYKYPSKKDKLIERFISRNFQTQVADYETHKYKPSIAFSNILLKNEGINCIIYPSVASNLKYVNYGIKPNFVDNHLFCRSAYIYEIRKGSEEFELVPLRYGNRIFPDPKSLKDSRIEWVENNSEEKKSTITYSLQ